MHSSQFLGLMLVFGGTVAAGIAHAQQAPVGAAPVAPAPVAPAPIVGMPSAESEPRGATASGFMVQVRMQAQSSLLSLGGGPGFLMGYRGPSFALGVGLGLTRLGLSSKQSGSTSASVSLLQIVPTVLIDVWHSPDGRARANLVGGIGYERASGSVTTESQSCFSTVNGTVMCTPSSSKDSVGASLIPVMLGVGGDYFLSRNFALGAEGGIQAAFLTGVDETSSGTTQTFDTTGDMEFAYGVIRATIVLGD